MMVEFNAIVPMACVAAAAIAAMIAEAFSVPGERMPIAPLGAIGLSALRCERGTLESQRVELRGRLRGQLRVVRDGRPDCCRPAVAGVVGTDHRS
jgi:hypothetical protein